MMFRMVATGLTAVGIAALAIGPVRLVLDQNDGEGDLVQGAPLVLTDHPGRAPHWRTGLVDTGVTDPVDGLRKVAAPTIVDYAQAAAIVDDPDVISVVGESSDRTLPGVGAVVTEAEAGELLGLSEPRRTRVLSAIADTTGLGLSVFAVDTPPHRSVVIDVSSRPQERRRLVRHDPEVAALVAGWAQLRPDLQAILSRGGQEDAAPASGQPDRSRPGDRAWSRAVSQAVNKEIYPALADRRAPLATHLLDGEDALATLRHGRLTSTARGAAYAVAANAVQPGSRVRGIRGASARDVRVLQRPDGRLAVLVWNPGAERTLTVQVPDATGVVRQYRLELGAATFSSAILKTD